jgi:galactonate dehydratase
MESMYQVRPSDATRFAELAQQAVADGFTAFKCMAVPETAPIEGLQPLRYAQQCVAAMREAVGPAIDIMVDCHARPSPRMGILFARALEPYGLYFLEEPCWPESVDGLAEVQRAVATPIATGERLVGQYAFRELLERRACSVVQPDITHCGGLSEARRIAAMAEAYRMALAPHNPQGPVSTAASLELGFATPSYLICETVHLDVPWRQEVVRAGFEVEVQGRIVRPSSRPGLGVELDEDQIRRHPFQQELLQRSFHPDGSVADW